jgi:hypothetical protein
MYLDDPNGYSYLKHGGADGIRTLDPLLAKPRIDLYLIPFSALI